MGKTFALDAPPNISEWFTEGAATAQRTQKSGAHLRVAGWKVDWQWESVRDLILFETQMLSRKSLINRANPL